MWQVIYRCECGTLVVFDAFSVTMVPRCGQPRSYSYEVFQKGLRLAIAARRS